VRYNEYQVGAIATAIYPHTHKLVYPALGLCGEVGELICALIREHQDYTKSDIKKETGDVLWYVANVANDMDALLCEIMAREDFQEYMGPWDVDEVGNELAINAGMVAESVKKAIRDNEGRLTKERRETIMRDLRWVVTWLERSCSNYDFTLEDCALLNLDKLRSRAERDVLKGEGDNR
jgi:NTP pyrophosphatase (non-canonical NTP hydrolase)